MGTQKIKCAVVGYGKNFNFGRMHGSWISNCEKLKLVAVCDIDPESRERAKRDFPGIVTYESVDKLVESPGIDLVTIVTPHYTHADIAMKSLRAGKNVLVDKAMATSVEKCTEMIEEAKRNKKSLAVFHNRRHDGNYRIIKKIINDGVIGDVFHIECCEERWERPIDWWYSSNKASGGLFFFWGPHAVDWVINLVPHRISYVTGFTQKQVWTHIEIDDDIRTMIKFENRTTAMINFSLISSANRPLWRILGTKGAIVDTGKGPIPGATIPGYGEMVTAPPPQGASISVYTHNGKGMCESKVPYMESDWNTYYLDLSEHLVNGKPLPVSGYEGRRVVAVLEATNRSAQTGMTEQVAFEDRGL